MSSHALSVHFFAQAAVILLACRLAGAVARRLGQPQVVGEMVAGVMLGPSLFGLWLPQWQQALFPSEAMGGLQVAAQLGIGLYMFLVGTEFQAELCRRKAGTAAAISLAGIAAPFALAFLLAPWLHTVPGLFPSTTGLTDATLFLGVAIAITAFPMLARLIQERGLAGTSLGTLVLSAGAVDDAAAWCILAVVLARLGGSWTAAGIAIVGGLAFAGLMITVAPRLLRRLADGLAPDAPLPAATLAMVLVLFSGCAFAMDAIGLHAVFGGFLLGTAMPRGPLTERLRESLQPFVTVFLLPMFFTWSGLNTDLALLLEPGTLAAAAAVLLASFFGKALACGAAARLAGEPPRDALAIGVLMNARGVMELIIINIGLSMGMILPGMFSILALMAVVTTLAATPLFNAVARLPAGPRLWSLPRPWRIGRR